MKFNDNKICRNYSEERRFDKLNKNNKTGFYKLIVYLAEQNKFENASDVRGVKSVYRVTTASMTCICKACNCYKLIGISVGVTHN